VSHLATAVAALDQVPGTVSVWCGPVGGPPRVTRAADLPHVAASTMKVAVLAALYRSGIDLDTEVPVVNEFDSAAPGAGRFGCDPAEDGDPEPWRRIGRTAPLRWLARRMIVRSSNLATNVVLAHVGLPAVDSIWRLVGAGHSVVGRGIEDRAAASAGIGNEVTASDLATLLGAIARGDPALVGAPEMLQTLLAQERRDDLAIGLPAGTPIAHKNGWIRGVRHSAGVVYPPDAPAYTVVVCATTPLAGAGPLPDPACRLLARLAAASWADRHG
jgi:beta-lactamase class A